MATTAAGVDRSLKSLEKDISWACGKIDAAGRLALEVQRVLHDPRLHLDLREVLRTALLEYASV